jgi:hypothetical protein
MTITSRQGAEHALCFVNDYIYYPTLGWQKIPSSGGSFSIFLGLCRQTKCTSGKKLSFCNGCEVHMSVSAKPMLPALAVD